MGPAEALGGLQENEFRDPVRILRHFAVPESNDAPAISFQKGSPLGVIALRLQMLRPVELHGELGLAAGQINDEGADDELPREGRAVTREPMPDTTLRYRGFAPKRPGAPRHFFRNPEHRPGVARRALLAYPPPTPPFQGGELRILMSHRNVHA